MNEILAKQLLKLMPKLDPAIFTRPNDFVSQILPPTGAISRSVRFFSQNPLLQDLSDFKEGIKRLQLCCEILMDNFAVKMQL